MTALMDRREGAKCECELLNERRKTRRRGKFGGREKGP
jgi:hypothetical protein